MSIINNLPDEITFEQIQELGFESVCYQKTIRGKWPFKANFNSTSFFISKNFLLTSAHNIVKTYREVNWLNIAPSRIGKTFHFGNFSMSVNSSIHFRAFPKYDMDNKSTRSLYDIALVYIPNKILEKNQNFPSLNSLTILNDISSLTIGEKIYCAGYPASNQHKNRYRMTLDTSEIIEIKEHSFKHNLDTATGNSGSPIMVKRNDKFFVIGINSIKFHGTLINNIKQKWLEESKHSLEI